MRRDDQPRQLLVGIIGEREHDPGRLSPRLERVDFDPADDAVGAWRGRDLDAIALGAVALDRTGQIDRVRVRGNSHRLHRTGWLAERGQRGEESEDADKSAPRA